MDLLLTIKYILFIQRIMSMVMLVSATKFNLDDFTSESIDYGLEFDYAYPSISVLKQQIINPLSWFLVYDRVNCIRYGHSKWIII